MNNKWFSEALISDRPLLFNHAVAYESQYSSWISEVVTLWPFLYDKVHYLTKHLPFIYLGQDHKNKKIDLRSSLYLKSLTLRGIGWQIRDFLRLRNPGFKLQHQDFETHQRLRGSSQNCLIPTLLEEPFYIPTLGVIVPIQARIQGERDISWLRIWVMQLFKMWVKGEASWLATIMSELHRYTVRTTQATPSIVAAIG